MDVYLHLISTFMDEAHGCVVFGKEKRNLKKIEEMILIENKKTKIEKLKEMYPGAQIIDVTSKSDDKFVMLSPFYPIGGIPVPFTPDHTAVSVEGIWQGLKVFEHEGVDERKLYSKGMMGLKRTSRSLGQCLGHQKGLNSTELLGYIEARKQIYVPSYNWMLKNRCWNLVLELKKMCVEGVVVLLDYDTNPDIEDYKKPLSHASLIVRAVEELLTEDEKAAWPEQLKELKARSKEETKRREERKNRFMEMKKAAAVVGNPSKYNPLWAWEQQKAKKTLGFVFFWKPGNAKALHVSKGCLSQWQKCEFVVDGVKYNCAEQYMMAEKARLFNDDEILAKILEEEEPDKIKELGREIKGFDPDVWNDHKFDIVTKGNLAKFSQNENMGKFLLETGDAILAEASPFDRIWGIGMKEGDKGINDTEKWYGINLLGFALMVVRDKLREMKTEEK